MDRFHEPGKDWGTKAFTATEIALNLDPASAEAYAVRGQTFFSPAKDWAWRNAMADERRALELNPRLEEAHEVISYIYWHLGLLDEAVAEALVALRENPQSNRARALLGFSLIDLGRPEEALPYIKDLPKSYPGWGRGWLEGLCFFYLGRTNEAAQALENLYHPDQVETVVIPSLQAMIAARAGRKDEALEKIQLASAGPTNLAHYHHIAYQIAVAYALMNEKKLALEWLKRSADNGCPCYRYFEIDPTLDNLRHDSGFISFMNQEKGNWERRKADLFGSASAVKQTGR